MTDAWICWHGNLASTTTCWLAASGMVHPLLSTSVALPLLATRTELPLATGVPSLARVMNFCPLTLMVPETFLRTPTGSLAWAVTVAPASKAMRVTDFMGFLRAG